MKTRLCILAIAMFGLVGCDEVSNSVTNGLARIGASRDATSQGIRTLSLLGGDVLVRGPEGYCVDQSASNSRNGFAILAGCALLSENAAVMSNLDGLIIIQIGDENTASVTGGEDAFATFLKSETGRGVLAGDGDLASVATVSTITTETAVLARFEDTSGPTVIGTSGPQWRGFLDVKGRLATVSVLSFDRDALSRSEGERLLVLAMAQLAEVNAAIVSAEENG